MRDGTHQEEWTLAFNEQIVESIENHTAVAAAGAFFKDRIIGGS